MASKFKKMWGVRYFYIPTGRWYGCRCYPTLSEAVDDFVKLFESEHVGAVRLYEPPNIAYRHYDDFLWEDAKIDHA